MKNFKIFLIIAIATFVLSSCEDDRDLATYTPENAKASSIITPEDGGSYVLLPEDIANDFETITWTASEYGVDIARVYTLELALQGTDFEPPVVMTTTNLLSYSTSVGELNLLLTDLGLVPDVASNIEMRVMTTVPESDVDTLLSDVTTFAITPYEYEKPNIITPTSGDYILEVDSLNEIPFEEFTWVAVNYGGTFVSSYLLEFDIAGNDFADAVEIYSGENISYTATMFELNNLMIGHGIEAGTAEDLEFRVVADTDGKGTIISEIEEYNIKSYTAELQVAPLYLVGDATSAGWDNANGIPIEWDKDNNVYSVITDFGDGIMKVLEVSGQWAPQWGDDGTTSGILLYRPDEDTTDPDGIPSPGTGSYKLIVDIVNLTYSFEAQ